MPKSYIQIFTFSCICCVLPNKHKTLVLPFPHLLLPAFGQFLWNWFLPLFQGGTASGSLCATCLRKSCWRVQCPSFQAHESQHCLSFFPTSWIPLISDPKCYFWLPREIVTWKITAFFFSRRASKSLTINEHYIFHLWMNSSFWSEWVLPHFPFTSQKSESQTEESRKSTRI